ncbi:T-cell immunoglobulin and mucin domain-containing protein 4 isoform X1 [Carassius auratus]|uniref:T-cell immunoglobulin and mucin domain-containing protein 4 isoform X1 n=1 Tax=Carassius auratus TaxID=7957 RepID=UPI000E3FA2E7|nr:T-cell immunoglobulin and mucin domain-containing protein 4-like isoform X1 [Carassius auratus]
MTDFKSWFFASWILCYLTISKSSDVIVQSFEGERVILPCRYDSKYHGKCAICWMIGDIPTMGCGNEVIGSDGDKVVRTKASRYQLEGRIKHGDVSLTILNVKKTDSGKYGCRIHVPGLFNDEKYYVHLIVKDAIIPTTWETTSMSSSTSEHETTGVFSTALTEAPGPTTPEPLVTTSSGLITSESQTTETSEVETSTTQESSSVVSSTNAPESSTNGLWLSDTTYAIIPTTWETTSISSSTSEHETTGVFSTALTEVETSTTQESSSVVSSTNAPESSTNGLWLSDTTYETSYVYRESSSLENKDSVNASAVIVPVLVLLLALIVIAVILILKRRKKTRVSVDITQNSETSVIYSNSGSSFGLYNRDMALENIFQIQPENEYEQWH